VLEQVRRQGEKAADRGFGGFGFGVDGEEVEAEELVGVGKVVCA
jgi:hypothetical protein